MRCIPEVIVELLAPYAEKCIGKFWMIFIGASAGIFKALICAFHASLFLSYSESNQNRFKFVYFLFFESFKALFSSFVGYGCTKLTKYYNAPELQTSAQGLYNGMYNAVGAAISGIIGYNTISDDDSSANPFKKFFIVSAIVGIFGLFPVFYLISKRSMPKSFVKR